jgi:ATP-dependent DNA helicase RecG
VTEEEVLALCQQGQGVRVAFKKSASSPGKLAETLTAMANGAGGRVLVGVDPKDSTICGLKDPNQALDLALQAALRSEPPLIIPVPQMVRLDGNNLLMIVVPAGLPHVYSVNTKYLIRDGSRNKPLSPRQLRLLMAKRGEQGFESRVARDASMEDLDMEKVDRYLALLQAPYDLSPQEVLWKRGCLVKRGQRYLPTNAGVLLFAKEPSLFFRNCEIIVVRYAGREMADAYLREDIRDTLPEQIRRAEAFMLANMRKGARLSRWEREELTEYPLEAVREAIVNGVAHRDYAIKGQEIRVLFFSDRIEFYSPGRLPGHVTIDNIVDERFSRNEVIVQVLADMGFIEKLGYGIDRMIRLMREDDLPPPVFEETAAGFKVTLYGHGQRLISDEVDASRWAHLGLNERQEQALAYLLDHKRITNREYRELCSDVSEETVRRDLAELVRRDILVKIGDKRGTFYIFK